MHGAAEVLNDWIRLWMAASSGVLLGAIALALAAGELLRCDVAARARKPAGHSRMPFPVETWRPLRTWRPWPLPGMSVVEAPNEATGVRGVGIRAAGCGVEMTWIGSRDDHP
jgi:hypothetical protein